MLTKLFILGVSFVYAIREIVDFGMFIEQYGNKYFDMA